MPRKGIHLIDSIYFYFKIKMIMSAVHSIPEYLTFFRCSRLTRTVQCIKNSHFWFALWRLLFYSLSSDQSSLACCCSYVSLDLIFMMIIIVVQVKWINHIFCNLNVPNFMELFSVVALSTWFFPLRLFDCFLNFAQLLTKAIPYGGKTCGWHLCP